MKQQILSLGKDSLIYGIGSVFTRFIGLITLPIFTAYLTPNEYGVMTMLSLLTLIAHPVFSLGLSAAMGPSYFKDEDPKNKAKTVWTVFALNAVSGGLLILIAWLFPEVLCKLIRLPVENSFLVSLSLTGCALTILVTSFTQAVQFQKEAKLYVFITLATAVIAILLSLLTVVFLGWGLTGMVVGQLAGNATTFVAFFFIGYKKDQPILCSVVAKKLLQLGLPLIPSFAFIFILMHGNKYILERQAGMDIVGIFSVGFNLGMAMSIITGGVSTAWYPFFMGYIDRQDQARVIFGKIFTYYFFGVGLICTSFFIFAKPVVIVFVNESYFDAYRVIGFIALGYFFQGVFHFFLPSLYYAGKVKYVSIVQGFAALISLPINYVLTVQYSLLGASIGVFIGNFLMALFLYLWNKSNQNKTLNVDYEWKQILNIVTLFLLVIVFYSSLPSFALLGEFIKSIAMLFLALVAVFFLLHESERQSIYLKFRRNSPK